MCRPTRPSSARTGGLARDPFFSYYDNERQWREVYSQQVTAELRKSAAELQEVLGIRPEEITRVEPPTRES